jgi:microcystin-dependent protein
VREFHHLAVRNIPVANLRLERSDYTKLEVADSASSGIGYETPRSAAMADPFVAEIRIFPFNFAPRGWAWCDGQLMPLSQNTALFSLLGTTYGGNGKSNFALPDLQGRSPMQPGQGPGLSLHDLGESSGSETVTLLESEMPAHPHPLNVSQSDGISSSPTGEQLATGIGLAMYAPPNSLQAMSGNALAPAGGDAPHNNMQPYLTFYFCIALQGVFPPRT